MKRVYIAGGGTFGHLRPALVLKKALEEEKIFTRMFCASKDKKFDLLKRESFLTYVPLNGMPRSKNILKLFIFTCQLVLSLGKIFFYFLFARPKVVMSCGGFVSFPVLFWGKIFRVPLLIVEQNSIPGLVNRLFIKNSKKAFFAMEPLNKGYLDLPQSLLVGNPLDLVKMTQEEALMKLGLDSKIGSKKVIGVLGGSLGALKINEWVTSQITDFEKMDILVLLVTGKLHYQAFKSLENNHFQVKEFVEDMSAFYSLSHTVISRAGASSVSEVLLFDKPTVFIPYPYATQNHQYHNAIFAQQYLRGCVINESDLENYILRDILLKIDASSAAKKTFKNEAKTIIVKTVKETLNLC